MWAPGSRRVELVLPDRREPLAAAGRGYHQAAVTGAPPGTRYRFSLDGGEELPDPASRWQPDGVFGASAVVDPASPWTDAGWRPPRLRDLVLYEIHVGTFTNEGTFDAVVPHLRRIADLGVTAIQLMPVAAFPGRRNWGYDGVFPFAVQASYGGPDGLRRLVDAAHAQGLAVHVDVVYNHLGPEGNVLARYGPYFTDRYRTPWGDAVNFAGPGSDEVRAFFISSALALVREHHVDGLRVDAIHGIVDPSARPFLAELVSAVHDAAPDALVIAESDLADPRVIRPAALGGLGFDAQWTNDLHHALHVALTGERSGYYADFDGAADLARALSDGTVFAGRYSEFRQRRHGAPFNERPPEQLVVAAQDHDQVGNRANGERLATLVPAAALRVAAVAITLSAYTPLLFMGEDHGETAPFLYFTDHADPELSRAVREGRRREFASFGWTSEADPGSEDTFRRSIVDTSLIDAPGRRELHALYRECLRLRRELLRPPRTRPRAVAQGATVVADGGDHCVVLGTSRSAATVILPGGAWRPVLDTEDPRWGGDAPVVPRVCVNGGVPIDIPPLSAVVLVRERSAAP